MTRADLIRRHDRAVAFHTARIDEASGDKVLHGHFFAGKDRRPQIIEWHKAMLEESKAALSA